jgi:hypothetical protein
MITTDYHVKELCYYLILHDILPAITLFNVSNLVFVRLRVAINQSNQLSIQILPKTAAPSNSKPQPLYRLRLAYSSGTNFSQ